MRRPTSPPACGSLRPIGPIMAEVVADLSLSIDLAQLRPRPIGPGELSALRSMWWNLAALGHRLPAEIDVIVVEGGRP